MQQAIVGLLAWQIIILPWTVDQERWIWMQMLSLTFLGGEHDQNIEANCVCALFLLAAQGATLMEAYSCNIWITETLDIPNDPKVMLVEDWVVAQSKDPVIREIKYLISKSKLRGHTVYSQNPQVTKQYLRQSNHLVLNKGVLYRK